MLSVQAGCAGVVAGWRTVSNEAGQPARRGRDAQPVRRGWRWPRCPATPLARITALVWAGGPLGQFRLRGVAAARYAKVLSLQPGCGLATCRAV